MKVLCEVQILNRNTQANRFPRPVKSTLAIGISTKAKTRQDESVAGTSGAEGGGGGQDEKKVEIILFTPQNKTGIRYKVINNIQQIFTKFVQDGKTTISFKEPPENIMIKCDPLQLKGFLETLKLGIKGKTSANLHLNIAAAMPIPKKSQPQLTLTVLKRGDYPTKGFPKSIKTLTISNIKLCKVTFEICSLRNLTVLNLSYNTISKIPMELGRLMLTELQLENNNLGETDDWCWLDGKNLQNSLRELDLSANKIRRFPSSLLRCEALVTLKLNNNLIWRLPFALRRLQHLRFLHLSTNQLESMPSVFNDLRLDLLDVWGNNFQSLICYNFEDYKHQTYDGGSKVPPLWLLASRCVNQYKLPYNKTTLPWILVDCQLQLPKCACGKLCYDSRIYVRSTLATFQNISQVVNSRDHLIYADSVFCGPKCLGLRHIKSFPML